MLHTDVTSLYHDVLPYVTLHPFIKMLHTDVTSLHPDVAHRRNIPIPGYYTPTQHPGTRRLNTGETSRTRMLHTDSTYLYQKVGYRRNILPPGGCSPTQHPCWHGAPMLFLISILNCMHV